MYTDELFLCLYTRQRQERFLFIDFCAVVSFSLKYNTCILENETADLFFFMASVPNY